ncbi:Sphingosine kinase 1-like protein [Drosera capensis]
MDPTAPVFDNEPSIIIHSDRVVIDGTLTPLTLFSDGRLRWEWEGIERWIDVEKEVVGVETKGSRRIVIKRAVEIGGGLNCLGSAAAAGDLGIKEFVFEVNDEEGAGQLLGQKLKEYLNSLGRPKRLFIFVNPFGGKKSAVKVFAKVVTPLLVHADINFSVHETQHQLHAKEVVQELDLTQYDGIVCVLNGLLHREDWETAIQTPIGIVPAGTGNGMAKSLLDSVGQPCSAFNAVLAIIRGHKQPLDVATISQGKTKFFSVLMLAWGLVADIDIESEKYRWMGSARLDFYAIQRIFHLRKYHGRIHFVPAPGFEALALPKTEKQDPSQQLKFYIRSEEEPLIEEHRYHGPTIDLENTKWLTIEGPFVSIWLHNVPWGSEGAKAAPDAKFSDGYLDLVLIRDCPKLALLALMTDLSTGNHVKSPHVVYLKVKSFILEPGPRTEDSTKGGIIDVDGEVLARGSGTYKCEQETLMSYDKLQISVHEGLASLFSPIL